MSTNGHLHAATLVDAEAFCGDSITFLADILDLLGPTFGQLGDVDEAVLAGKDFHKCTESSDRNDRTGVGLADFDFLEHAIDHFLGALQSRFLRSVDMDSAVVLNVDFGTRLGLDGLDVFAARSDQLTDAVSRNAEADNTRSEGAHFAWGGDGLSHLVEHQGAAILGDVDGFLEHGQWQAGQLEVQLVASHAVAGAAEFEVHITVEVLGTDDVQEHLVLLE